MKKNIIFLIVVVLFLVSGCDKLFPEEEPYPDPNLGFIESLKAIADIDTLIIPIEGKEGLSKVTIEFLGKTNYETYFFTITQEPFRLVLDARDFKSDDYYVSIKVYDHSGDVNSVSSFTMMISNPNEEDLAIAPIPLENYDNLWIVVEDTSRNVLYTSKMQIGWYHRIKIPDSLKPAEKIYNLHFLLENNPNESDKYSDLIQSTNVLVKSIFNFKGHFYNPGQYFNSTSGIKCVLNFGFSGIPAHSDYYLFLPLDGIYGSRLETSYTTFLTQLYSELYIYLENEDTYAKHFYLNCSDALLDLSDMQKVDDYKKLELIGKEYSIEIGWLKDYNRDCAAVYIYKNRGDSDTNYYVPYPDFFNSFPVFSTEVIFGNREGNYNRYIYRGEIPKLIIDKDISYQLLNDNKMVEISTVDDFQYFQGKKTSRNINGVNWQFISNKKTVKLPDFPAELYEDMPELKTLAPDGHYSKGFTDIAIVNYSNFKNYQELLMSWDLLQWLPVDNGEHFVEEFNKHISYY